MIYEIVMLSGDKKNTGHDPPQGKAVFVFSLKTLAAIEYKLNRYNAQTHSLPPTPLFLSPCQEVYGRKLTEGKKKKGEKEGRSYRLTSEGLSACRP